MNETEGQRTAKPLVFEGNSDDTFGEYSRFHDDHDNCANGRPIVFKVWSESEGRGLYVWGQYAGRDWPKAAPACWMIGVQQIEEDEPLPAWPLRYDTAHLGYSPRLIIEAPADAEMSYLGATGGGQ